MKHIPKQLLIIFCLLLVNISPCFAEIKRINVGVDGISCPFCVLGIEKKLNTLAFIKSTEFHLKDGVAELTLKPNSTFNIKAIKQAVKEAGFTFRDINLTVTGNIASENANLALESAGDKTLFVLYDKAHIWKEILSKNPEALEEKTKQLFLIAKEKGKSVTITGKIHEHADMPPGLLIKEYKVNQ